MLRLAVAALAKVRPHDGFSELMCSPFLSKRFMTLAAFSVLGAATAVAGTNLVDDPLRGLSGEFTPDQSVLRIVRDYNNDGLPDAALGLSDSCGNKTCSFTLFLKVESGGYIRAGEIGGLPWGYRIVPERRGGARWETCSASGEQVTFHSIRISESSMTAGQSRALHGDEGDRLCQWTEQFTWQECDVGRYLQTGACEWVPNAWP